MSADGGLHIREAEEGDVPAILEMFELVYGADYPHAGFLDEVGLKRSIYTDDILMLVAVDEESGKVVGTGSVVFDIGAHSDLIGEFGRLVVHPAARGKGVGKAIMERRVELIANRLHVGVVENRAVHPFSQRISRAHGFAAVGFQPMKHLFRYRESIALFCRHFGSALSLRRNHPRLVPEAAPLAHLAMTNCGLPFDAIVDEASAGYPVRGDFEIEELTAEGLPTLLRIERGRLENREVFGPMRLQYGFFKLTARRATYLLAREPRQTGKPGPIAGAIGYMLDHDEKTVRVFELITRTDEVVRFLFADLLERCRRDWDVEYVEIDVSAHAPRLQRTLVELGFVPAAYVPAMAFHQVERLDVIKFALLLVQPDLGDIQLVPAMQEIQERVMGALTRKSVLPDVARAVNDLRIFKGLDEDQRIRVAGVCDVARFDEGESLFEVGAPAEEMFILIDGSAEVHAGEEAETVGAVGPGESVGEMALLTGGEHTATVKAKMPVVAAVLSRLDLAELTRQRPDIGVVLYLNLAVGLGEKLRRVDEVLLDKS